MNVKFKMPKFGRNLSGKGWFKELLMTTLATTISIVLTFGTAQYIEDRQTEQARRMMAMTIIDDIDQSLEVIKKRKDAEEKGHEASCYLIENMDRLESIGEDMLQLFINYVTYASSDPDMEFKTMNENIFNSSQDTWRKLNDRKFLNNVQKFYTPESYSSSKARIGFSLRNPSPRKRNTNCFWADRLRAQQTYADGC